MEKKRGAKGTKNVKKNREEEKRGKGLGEAHSRTNAGLE